jgi:Matrixin
MAGRARQPRRLFLAAATALAAVTLAGGASAFCRTTTVPVAPDFQPTDTKCWDQGNPLFWLNTCVGYDLNQNASRQVAYDDAANAMSLAFSKWTGTACPTDGTGTSRVSIDVRDLGPVSCDQVGYNQTGPNQNVILFRDDKWPHNDSNNTLALTTVTFNPDTGEIFDADMEINTADQTVTLQDPIPPSGYDFASIVTHETGHFLGMAHSGDSHATMYASYTPGATAMRYLTDDDVNGICTIYHPDGQREVLSGQVTPGGQCDPTPRRGLTSACADDANASGGKKCDVAGVGEASGASGTTGTSTASALFAIVLATLAARRRSKRM